MIKGFSSPLAIKNILQVCKTRLYKKVLVNMGKLGKTIKYVVTGLISLFFLILIVSWYQGVKNSKLGSEKRIHDHHSR